jgi:hypothetical protein
MADQPPAAARPPAPGDDEILVTRPPGRALCSNREHRRLYVLAEVVITFGELGTAWQKDALWFHNWHKSFSLCRTCFDTVIAVAREHRPGLVLVDATTPGTPAPEAAPREPNSAAH